MKKYLVLGLALLFVLSYNVFASGTGAHSNTQGKGHTQHQGNGYGHSKTKGNPNPPSNPPGNGGGNNSNTVTNSVVNNVTATSAATSTSSSTGNIVNLSGLDNASAGGSLASLSADSNDSFKSYSAPGFSSSEGTDTVQVGSLLFGSITISTDERSMKLRKNMETVHALNKAGFITRKQAEDFAEYVIEEIKNESKPSKCLGFIPCGKERKLTNLFKLI